LVTAAAPRDLRIDPYEKKSRELNPAAPWSIDGRRSSRERGSSGHGRSTCYSGKTAAKFAKK